MAWGAWRFQCQTWLGMESWIWPWKNGGSHVSKTAEKVPHLAANVRDYYFCCWFLFFSNRLFLLFFVVDFCSFLKIIFVVCWFQIKFDSTLPVSLNTVARALGTGHPAHPFKLLWLCFCAANIGRVLNLTEVNYLYFPLTAPTFMHVFVILPSFVFSVSVCVSCSAKNFLSYWWLPFSSGILLVTAFPLRHVGKAIKLVWRESEFLHTCTHLCSAVGGQSYCTLMAAIVFSEEDIEWMHSCCSREVASQKNCLSNPGIKKISLLIMPYAFMTHPNRYPVIGVFRDMQTRNSLIIMPFI